MSTRSCRRNRAPRADRNNLKLMVEESTLPGDGGVPRTSNERMDSTMRKLQSSFFLAGVLAGMFILAAAASIFAIERQPNSDYHARREALAKKAAGVVVLFAATENDGPNDLYGFRQDDHPSLGRG